MVGSPARLLLTVRDQGRTVRVSRSTRITLVLGGRYRWSKPRSTGVRVDVQAVLSDAPTGGQTWELRPLGRGRAPLTSTGSPACRPTTPGCPTVARRYTVTLDVRASRPYRPSRPLIAVNRSFWATSCAGWRPG